VQPPSAVVPQAIPGPAGGSRYHDQLEDVQEGEDGSGYHPGQDSDHDQAHHDQGDVSAHTCPFASRRSRLIDGVGLHRVARCGDSAVFMSPSPALPGGCRRARPGLGEGLTCPRRSGEGATDQAFRLVQAVGTGWRHGLLQRTAPGWRERGGPTDPPSTRARCWHALPVISVEDYLYYVDVALDGMIEIVEQLGDDLANRRPDANGANTPYVILSHCLGVMEFWAGHAVAGRTIERDRDAEFVAHGPVDRLVIRARRARVQLAQDLAALEPVRPPRLPVGDENAALPIGSTQGGALIHLYEELAQHHGQMESIRDVLGAPWARLTSQ
jgi:Protein of unknown function (DUF664)